MNFSNADILNVEGGECPPKCFDVLASALFYKVGFVEQDEEVQLDSSTYSQVS